MDIDVAMIGHASDFWEVRKSSNGGMTKSGFLLSLECGETLVIPALCLTYHH